MRKIPEPMKGSKPYHKNVTTFGGHRTPAIINGNAPYSFYKHQKSLTSPASTGY